MNGSEGMGWGNVRATVEHGVPGALLRGQQQAKPPVRRAPLRAVQAAPQPATQSAAPSDALTLLRLEGARALLTALGVEVPEGSSMDQMVEAAGRLSTSNAPQTLGMQLVEHAIGQIDELRNELALYLGAPPETEDAPA